MDFLEKYIKENREAFDLVETPSHVWQKVEDALCDFDKNDIERFVGAHKNEFDVASPPPSLWEKIEQDLPKAEKESKTKQATKTVRMWPKMLLRVAAAAILLVGGIGIGLQIGNQQSNDVASANVLSFEQNEALNAFERDINVKMVAASSVVSNDPIIQADLEKLDVAMKELKTELEDVPPGNREQVVHAMLENYRAKVHVLERILTHIELQNNDSLKNTNHERMEI